MDIKKKIDEYLNEKRNKLDSEYLKRNAELLSKDMMDDNEKDLAMVFDMISSRINQQYPGNVDISPQDIKNLIDSKFLKKYNKTFKEAIEILFEG